MPDVMDLVKAQVRSRMPPDARRSARWWLEARRDALLNRTGLVRGWTVLWRAGGTCELVPIDVAGPGPGHVTVGVDYSAVSPGTERARFLRLPHAQPTLPHRPGNSLAGIVLAAGADTAFAPGDEVAVMGAPHASVVTVPAAAATRVPAGVGLAEASTVRLGVISGLGPSLGRVGAGDDVCVLGAGLIGLLAARLAVARGARTVTVVARSSRKADVAGAGGVTQFLAGPAPRELDELGASVVIEATGDPAAIDLAIAAAAPRARIVLLGSSRGGPHRLDVDAIRAHELELVGAHVDTLALTGPDADAAAARDYLHVLAGGLDIGDLVAERVDPRECGLFYRRLATSSGVVGALFAWDGLQPTRPPARSAILRRPDLGPAGNLPATAAAPRRGALHAPAGPFAGASGHLRIGLLGAGDIAVRNAAGIGAAPNTELAACFDPVPALAEDIARRYGGEAVASAEALFEDPRVDAVFLCVPHHLHAPLALEAIAAGKHVIVEKPPANDLAGAVAMSDAAARAGVRLTVCFPHRYDAGVATARRLVEAGALGALRGGAVSFLSDKPASYWSGGFSGRAQSDWRASREKAGGGVLIMNLSHYVDLLLMFARADIDEVTATSAALEGPPEVEDAIAAAIRFAGGALATVTGCSSVRGLPGGSEVRLWGRDGHIEVEPEPRVYTMRAVDGVHPGRWQTFGELPDVPIRAVFASRFATAVAEDREPEVTPDQALAVQAVMAAAYASAETGAPVRPADLLAAARPETTVA
jgi:predicted dehydrogenase/NADPH:quinone reductase-like Zn-dependent oxidoreductase